MSRETVGATGTKAKQSFAERLISALGQYGERPTLADNKAEVGFVSLRDRLVRCDPDGTVVLLESAKPGARTLAEFRWGHVEAVAKCLAVLMQLRNDEKRPTTTK